MKDVFVPDYELEVTVQEIDEELRKVILVVDFSEFLNTTSESSEE